MFDGVNEERLKVLSSVFRKSVRVIFTIFFCQKQNITFYVDCNAKPSRCDFVSCLGHQHRGACQWNKTDLVQA